MLKLCLYLQLSPCPSFAKNNLFLEVSKSFKVDAAASSQLEYFCQSPHPFGSKRQEELANWLVSEAKGFSSGPYLQTFQALTPNPKNFPRRLKGELLTIKRSGQNVIAPISLSANPSCYVLLGSHYDSKYLHGEKSLGANDSGSTSVLLLQLGKYLHFAKNRHKIRFECDIALVWFDGEEAVLPDWNDGQFRYPIKIHDNTYGSRHFVSMLTGCGQSKCLSVVGRPKPMPLRFMVLLDMLGSKSLKITDDLNSTLKLRKLLQTSLKLLGEEKLLSKPSRSVLDDHIPFLQAGIPSLNIIDFENLQRWHTPSDLPAYVHMPSMSRSGRLALLTLLPLLANPQDF